MGDDEGGNVEDVGYIGDLADHVGDVRDDDSLLTFSSSFFSSVASASFSSSTIASLSVFTF